MNKKFQQVKLPWYLEGASMEARIEYKTQEMQRIAHEQWYNNLSASKQLDYHIAELRREEEEEGR